MGTYVAAVPPPRWSYVPMRLPAVVHSPPTRRLDAVFLHPVAGPLVDRTGDTLVRAELPPTSFFVLFVITSMSLAILQARPRGSVMSGAAVPTAPAPARPQRPVHRAMVDRQRAAHHRGNGERAVLHEVLHEGLHVLAEHLAGVEGDAARHVARAEDGDAVRLHGLAGAGELAVAAALRGEVHDHGAGAHGRHHLGGHEARRRRGDAQQPPQHRQAQQAQQQLG